MPASEVMRVLGSGIGDAGYLEAEFTVPSGYKRAHMAAFGYLDTSMVVSVRDWMRHDRLAVCSLPVDEGADADHGLYALIPGPQRQLDACAICSGSDWKCSALELLEAVEVAAVPLMQTWRSLMPQLVAMALEPGAPIHEVVDAGVEQAFQRLVETWRAETAFASSVTEIAMNRAYQRIIGMGRRALPLILRELRREPNHWFWALHAITGENPVPPEDAGDIEKMAQAWLRLARERGWPE